MEYGIWMNRWGGVMKNRRMQQLVNMFSDISGVSEKEAEEIILKTDTGKAVLDNNETVLYEQQTENLYSIAMELFQISEYSELAKLFSVENIVDSMKRNRSNETVKVCFDGDQSPKIKEKIANDSKKELFIKQRKMLRTKRQNQINIRRIEDANRITRQK